MSSKWNCWARSSSAKSKWNCWNCPISCESLPTKQYSLTGGTFIALPNTSLDLAGLIVTLEASKIGPTLQELVFLKMLHYQLQPMSQFLFNCAPALSPYPLANSFSTISNTLKWTPGLALDLLMNWGSFNGHIRTHFILSWWTPTILGLATPWTPTNFRNMGEKWFWIPHEIGKKSEICRSARRVVPGPLCPSCSQAGPPGRGRGCHLRLCEDVGRQGDGWRGSMGLGLRILYLLFLLGYGSIPISTIFSGMNIHLPAILGFTRYQGFDPSPLQNL